MQVEVWSLRNVAVLKVTICGYLSPHFLRVTWSHWGDTIWDGSATLRVSILLRLVIGCIDIQMWIILAVCAYTQRNQTLILWAEVVNNIHTVLFWDYLHSAHWQPGSWLQLLLALGGIVTMSLLYSWTPASCNLCGLYYSTLQSCSQFLSRLWGWQVPLYHLLQTVRQPGSQTHSQTVMNRHTDKRPLHASISGYGDNQVPKFRISI